MKQTNRSSERSRLSGNRDRYFNFLCDIVGREYGYGMLLEHLHGMEFYSLIPFDENRGFDGIDFRDLYFENTGRVSNFAGPCSVLEMLLGVSRRLEFGLIDSEWERSTGDWFWVLLGNLGLDILDDVNFRPEIVDRKIDVLLERRYSSKGKGSLFPLRKNGKDVRTMEIWNQMGAWVSENFPI